MFGYYYCTLLLEKLYGHHGQVVALLGIANELVDGFGHPGNQLVGLMLAAVECTAGHVGDALHLELGLVGIHSLGESVGKEEDGGAAVDLCLLQGELPFGPEADGDVRVAGQLSNASADEQGGIVAGVTVMQKTCGQVEHSNEEGHEHVVLIHVGNRLVHDGHDTVGHRLMGRYGAEGRTGHRHE